MATVLINVLIWGQHASLAGIGALCVCLVGATLYQQSPLRHVPTGDVDSGEPEPVTCLVRAAGRKVWAEQWSLLAICVLLVLVPLLGRVHATDTPLPALPATLPGAALPLVGDAEALARQSLMREVAADGVVWSPVRPNPFVGAPNWEQEWAPFKADGSGAAGAVG